MDSGHVLATGTPAALVAARGAATLEDAFISHIEEVNQAVAETTEAPAPLSTFTAYLGTMMGPAPHGWQAV